MIELLLNADGDLQSMFTRALAGRRVQIAGNAPDGVHLHTASAISWRKASGSATMLLRELRQLQATGTDSDDYDERSVSQALGALIYAATETFDLYQSTIPKRLEKGRGRMEGKLIRAYQDTVKRLRDPVALMCNRMKHDYREIVTCRIMSESTKEATFVYRINVAQGGVQSADREVHREGGFASFERTLHEILHGLLRADFRAGELVDALSDDHDAAIETKGASDLGLAYVLGGLVGGIPIVANSEPSRFDGIRVFAGKAMLTRVTARKVAEPTRRTMKATMDGAAPTVRVFTT